MFRLRAGEGVLPDLLAGRYDAWLTREMRERLKAPLARRDAAAFRVSVKDPERLGLLQHGVPEYPPLAIERRIFGTVRLEVEANPDDGRVRDVRVLAAYPLFRDSVVAAVRGWRGGRR
jgi:TonB family protein